MGLADALPAARWLIQQRNPTEASGAPRIRSWVWRASPASQPWRTRAGWTDVVQRLELPLGQRFRASADGTGQVAFTSTVEFNVLEMAEEPRFDFSVAWSAAPAVAASRKMRARVEPLGGGKGGMAVMELGLFTGTAV